MVDTPTDARTPGRYLLADKLLLQRVLPKPALGVLLGLIARLPDAPSPVPLGAAAVDLGSREPGEGPDPEEGQVAGDRLCASPPLLARAALKVAQVSEQACCVSPEYCRIDMDAERLGVLRPTPKHATSRLFFLVSCLGVFSRLRFAARTSCQVTRPACCLSRGLCRCGDPRPPRRGCQPGSRHT